MKHSKNKLALAILAAAAVGIAGLGNAGIKSTLHNLGSTGTGDTKTTAGTGSDEICVFCHTPHGSDTGAPVPLWNKNLDTGATYVLYDQLGTSSLDGSVASVGSVSLACLSCHDGVQAMDNMINAPGSGGYASNGGGVSGTDMTWATGGNSNAITGGRMAAAGSSPFPQLGADLKNDHPVGVQYCGGGIDVNTVSGTQGDCVDDDFFAPIRGGTDGQPMWWVNTGTTDLTTREKTDMQLYTRVDLAGDAAPQPFVECASCHDPHTVNPTFLRVVNTGSAVCLACHNK